MIYLILGRPGGGKSYEATVYHILPALMDGRKVITNLPVNVERLAAIVPNLKDVLEVRKKSLSSVEGTRVFSSIEDYANPWRHPETGAGPLYVIDECHKAIPKLGTPRDVEEWFAEHRHETADVLLISQSFGKLNRAIVEMVDVCYQVAKATAFGSTTRYVRKVKFGVRGEVVNTAIRTYEPKYFPLYQSHTRGGGAELGARDVKPIWKHWTFVGAAILLTGSIGFMLINGVNFFGKPATPDDSDGEFVTVSFADIPVAQDKPAPPPPAITIPEPPQSAEPEPPPFSVATDGPFEGMGMHLAGWLQMGGQQRYLVALSQNGVVVRMTDSDELRRVGYDIEPVGECAMRAGYGKNRVWVRCDMPRARVTPFGGVGTRSQPSAGQAAGGSPASAGEAPPT